MGLLTTSALNLITGARPPRYRQLFTVSVPENQGHLAYASTVFHDDDPSVNDVKNVTDPGSRDAQAYNISLQVEGSFGVGLYRFEVRNDHGLFYRGATGGYFVHPTTAYEAAPNECYVQHQVFVLDTAPGSGMVTWVELTPIDYTGSIKTVSYKDTGRPSGAAGHSAVITCEPFAVAEILRRQWSESDGDDADTGANITMKA